MGTPLTLALNDLLSELRARVAEPNSGYYTKEELVRWLNLGLRDFCTRTKLLRTSATANSVIGQKKYALPTDYQIMEKAFYDSTELTPLTDDELMGATTRTGIDTAGASRAYYVRGAADSGLCLFLYPVPSAIKVIEIWYVAQPDALSDVSPNMLLPQEWCHAILLFAESMAHRKQRQLADAKFAQDQYKELLVEAHMRRIEWQLDKPIGMHDAGLWAHKGYGDSSVMVAEI